MKRKRMIKAIRILTLVLALLVVTAAGISFGADIPSDIEANEIITGDAEHGATGQSAEIGKETLEETAQQPEGTEEALGEDVQSEEGNEQEALPDGLESEAKEQELPEHDAEQAKRTEDIVAEIQPLDAGYILLEDGISAVVTDFAQLKEVTEGNNGIVNVYLGADIELLQNRTVIPATKPEFKLSGKDPRTGIQYTITEYKTTGLANIVVPGGNKTTRTVTMEDMTIINQGDYYGLIGIEDTGGGVDMVVRNVAFTGRQFAYNPYGTLIFEGTNSITIQNTGGATAEELAEVLNVTVRGTLDVDFQSAGYHVFDMQKGAGKFLVEGRLTVNAPNLYETLGVINCYTTENAVDIELKPGANMHVTANTRLVDAVANNLTVGTGASFRYEKTGGLADTAYAAISLHQKLTVQEGATFYVSQSANGASYLLKFTGVPSGMSGGVMEFNNPKQVTLINEGSRAMVYGEKKEEFNVTAQYLDYWTSSQGLGEEPAYRFLKAQTEDGQDISIKLVHKAGIPTSLTTNHSGITAGILKLDASVKQVVFGQEPKATLKFSAQHEETGTEIPGFRMDDIEADMGITLQVQPPEVPGHIVTGYSVDGSGMQELKDGYAAITPEAGTVNIVFYYVEPIIDVSVPVKMLFTAYEEDGGNVTSREYSFTNNSRFGVDVSLAGVSTMQETDSIELVGEGGATGENQLWLYLDPQDTDRFQAVDVLEPTDGNEYIGNLHGSGDTMAFSLAGMYYGSFGNEPKWPAYHVEFAFGLSI